VDVCPAGFFVVVERALHLTVTPKWLLWF
jgi:hypothetical protein